jgi:hypothetical protein
MNSPKQMTVCKISTKKENGKIRTRLKLAYGQDDGWECILGDGQVIQTFPLNPTILIIGIIVGGMLSGFLFWLLESTPWNNWGNW